MTSRRPSIRGEICEHQPRAAISKTHLVWPRHCRGQIYAVAECIVSIAESYRAMAKDIQREAEGTKDEAVRAAYIALADLWLARAIQLDQSVGDIPRNPLALAQRVAASRRPSSLVSSFAADRQPVRDE